MSFRSMLLIASLMPMAFLAMADTTSTQSGELSPEGAVVDDVRVKGFIPDRVMIEDTASPQTDTSIPALSDTTPNFESKPAEPAAAKASEAPKSKPKPSTAREDRLGKEANATASKSEKNAETKTKMAEGRNDYAPAKKPVMAKKSEPKKAELTKPEPAKRETVKKHDIVDLDSAEETPVSANPVAGKSRKSGSGAGVVISTSTEKVSERGTGKMIADRPSRLPGQTNSPSGGEAPISIQKSDLAQRQSTSAYTDAAGLVTGIRQERDGSLRLVLRTDDGDDVQVVVQPEYGVRVPMEGTSIRVHGKRISLAGERQVIRASEIDRVSPSRRERAEVRPEEPPYPMMQEPFMPGPMFVPPPPPGFMPGGPGWY